MGLIEESIKRIEKDMTDYMKGDISTEQLNTITRCHAEIGRRFELLTRMRFMDRDTNVVRNLTEIGLIGEKE